MAKADFYLYIKAKPAANTELLCFFLTLKLYGRKSNLLLGASGKNTIVLKQNSNRLKPFYKGMITNGLVTVPLVPGLYLVSTYRSGGYKISSLSIVNIQAQDGSFIETLVKGADYDNTIEMKYTDSNISFQYKIDLSGGCTIIIFKLA